MTPSEIKASYDALRQNARSQKAIKEWFKKHATDVTTMPAIYAQYLKLGVSNGDEIYNATKTKGGAYVVFEIEMEVKLTAKQATEMAWLGDVINFDGDIPSDRCAPWAARYGIEIPVLLSPMAAALLIERWFDTGVFDGDPAETIEEKQIVTVLAKHFPGLTIDILKMMHDNGMLPSEPAAFTAWAIQMSSQGVPAMELPSAGM